MNINTVVIGGRLSRDPQLHHLPSGASVADLGLAVNRVWTDRATNERREDVTFVDASVYGKQAEAAAAHLTKGSNVLVEGRLQLDSWDDKQTGQKRSKLRVVATRIHFADRPPTGPQTAEAATSGDNEAPF